MYLLKQVEETPGITVGKAGQAVTRIGLEGQFGAGEGAGPLEEFRQFLSREGLQGAVQSGLGFLRFASLDWEDR